jgi:hypothetical protein
VSKTSVDLDRRCDSLDAMMAGGFDVTADTGDSVETEVHQPDPLPDMSQCRGVCWRTMHEIATRNHRAALVLLASAMGGMSNREMGRALHLDAANLQRQKSWLKSHYPLLAAMLKK